MFADEDLNVRPHPRLERDRTPREHMVHQCMSEDKWFCGMFGIDVAAPPLPTEETRIGFIQRYAEDSGERLARPQETDNAAFDKRLAQLGVGHSAIVPRDRWG